MSGLADTNGGPVAIAVLLQTRLFCNAPAQFYASGLAGIEKDPAKADCAAADWAHPSATFELAALHLVRRRVSAVDANS